MKDRLRELLSRGGDGSDQPEAPSDVDDGAGEDDGEEVDATSTREDDGTVEDDGEELPALAAVDDPELDALDRAAAEEWAGDIGEDEEDLSRVMARMEPLPPLPLQAPFTTGLGPLLRRWAEAEGPDSFAADRRVQRVVGLIGDRLSVRVSADGITVRGLLRSRTVPWSRIQGLTFVTRHEMMREYVIAKLVDQSLKQVRLPIPGLRWLLRGILDRIERMRSRGAAPEDDDSGAALVQIRRRRGRDVTLDGILGLVSFLSEVLSIVVEHEASHRGIPVEGYAAPVLEDPASQD